ncbi:hypothetical protein [Paraburkholderia sp. A3RO-2L]|jgi:hypothetical protein|uniref:hypothetical protein n=1 Tax=unclassified Paraburkholderia TaxID=2615204 RepID=UPI003DA80708
MQVTLEAAQRMGENGAPHNEDERLLFEAYMKGHCWAVGTWLPEKGHYADMGSRMLFAMWRDRAALAEEAACSSHTEYFESAADMSLAVALDFADHPRPYHTLQAPADTNGELYRALRVLAQAYRNNAHTPNTSEVPAATAEKPSLSWEELRGNLATAIVAFSVPGRIGGQSHAAAERLLDALTQPDGPLPQLRERFQAGAPLAGEEQSS